MSDPEDVEGLTSYATTRRDLEGVDGLTGVAEGNRETSGESARSLAIAHHGKSSSTAEPRAL